MVRGLYLTRPELPSRWDWITAARLLAGRDYVISGWDAVRAYGIGADRAPTDEILVLAAAGTHHRVGRLVMRPSARPVIGNLIRPREGVGIRTVRVAAPARAVADTALTYRMFEPVRALATAAVQRRLCTPAQLVHELETGPRAGSAFLRRAVADVLEGAESISEAELAEVLRRVDVPRFELNVPILDHTGRVIAIVDVLWRRLRAALEVDSKQHHFFAEDWARTMRRHNMLTASGIATTHYPPSDIRAHPAVVAREVASWLRARAAELDVPYHDAAPGPTIRRAPLRLLPP